MELALACNRSELLAVKTYKEAKMLALDYQQAKKHLFQHCQRKGYGMWMQKPDEEKEFDVLILNRFPSIP